jgi:peptidoglycan hydrolase-like protein with peptidoglycan-binding domain
MKTTIKSNPVINLPLTKPFPFFLRNKFSLLLVSLVTPSLLGLSALETVAAPVQIAQSTPKTNINRPTLKIGSQGVAVSELQAALKLLGYYTGVVDGTYNQSTATAVSQFQKAAGLSANGVVDNTTWERLFPNQSIAASSPSSSLTDKKFPVPSSSPNNNRVVLPSNPRPTIQSTTVANNTVVNSTAEPRPATPTTTNTTSQKTTVQQPSTTRPSPRSQPSPRSRETTRSKPSPRPQPSPRSRETTRTQKTPAIQYTAQGLPILRRGMRGSEVVRLQQQLNRLGYLKGSIDGDFGEVTETAVKALQKRYGLEPDGVVGGATWEILRRRR